jgi:hypothetical protein
MTARSTPVVRQFSPTHKSKFKNIFVNGCSYTWNNSQSAPVTWPYYLRDLCEVEQVFDCSQGASGSNHIFTSTIYEIENNLDINCQDTLVIIMWSGLSRVDLVARKDIDTSVNKKDATTNFWLHNRYQFFDDLISVPLTRFNDYDNNFLFDQLRKAYHKLIDTDAQIVSSATKILSLSDYLKNKGFTFIFLNWQKRTMEAELEKLPNNFSQTVRNKICGIKSLGEYADENNLRIPNDGHPSPDAHLNWTRQHLLPMLEDLGYVTNNNQ